MVNGFSTDASQRLVRFLVMYCTVVSIYHRLCASRAANPSKLANYSTVHQTVRTVLTVLRR
jgi:hypothetical protein